MDALNAVANGDSPDVVYLELLANAEDGGEVGIGDNDE